MWRNWYTHSTQNAARNHVGSSPTIGTSVTWSDQLCDTKNGTHTAIKLFLKMNEYFLHEKNKTKNPLCPEFLKNAMR